MSQRLFPAVLVALLATVALAPPPAAAATCESLAGLALPDTTITAATSIDPPPDFVVSSIFNFAGPTVISSALCRVQGSVRPTADSNIKFEVWLPAAGWNGKFQAVGAGGSSGAFNYPAMAAALARGYATMATDNGHTSDFADMSWALGHPEKVVDFGHRAQHVTTVAAKALVAAFYTTGPRLSYFTGCSQGGHHALMEAQRYPSDYDGILAGAPAHNWTHLMTGMIWSAYATLKDAASNLPASKLALINSAAVAACDGLDGVTDGLIDDPRRCDFDPRTIQCAGADDGTCLTAAQVKAVRTIYAGARNPRTGAEIYPGWPRGSELGWPSLFARPFGLAGEFFKHVAFEDPSFDWRTFDYDADMAFTDAKLAAIINATDPDLSVFKALGGKLIVYHGWNDQAISAQDSINYYQSVVATLGNLRKTEDFFRLFLAPGMTHCSGGVGPNTFDALTALEQWVEHGVAPDKLIAARTSIGFPLNAMTEGTGDFTRPLCPYPRVARYRGTGSTDDAANFGCELKGLDRADEASGFDHGLQGRNNARRKQAR